MDTTENQPPRGFPWGDRLIAVLVFAFVIVIGSLWYVHLTGSLPEVKITGFDAITTPGGTTTLAAKLEINQLGPINPDLEGIQVEFASALTPAPISFETDEEGIAEFYYSGATDEGSFRFHARPADRDAYRVNELEHHGAASALWVWPADAPIVICDIDDTITDGEGWKTLIDSPGPDPMEGAAEALTRLATKKRLVFVTARDDSILNATRYWLLDNRFPRAPVIGRDWTLTNMTNPGPDKLGVFRRLEKSFSNIQLGIGNSEGDCYAYRELGIPHITLEESRCQGIEGAPSCRVAANWRDVARFLSEQ